MSPAQHRAAAALLVKVAGAESTAALRAELHALADWHKSTAETAALAAVDLAPARRPDPRNDLCQACAAPLPGPAQICPDCTAPFFIKITP
ncbi:MAG: hypothetical protein H7067_07580 [Burkholderiales bacterium]|nr:hypothetical protein [Opitutaceae bacterium]